MIPLFAIGVPELIIFIVIPFIVLPIYAMIDISRSKLNPALKLISVLLILGIPLLGSIAYFILGKRN